MRHSFIIAPSVTLMLLLGGCTTSSPQASLPNVQTQLTERAGIQATWPLTDDERAGAETAVRDILSTDLTVDSAVRIALLNNRNLRATFEELGLSQAGLAAATRLPNPSFDASVRWPKNAPRGPNVEFGLSIPLIEALLLPARKIVAQNQLLQTQYRVSHEVLALVAEVRSSVYSVLGHQELRDRLAVLAEISQAAAEIGQRQYDAGNITQLELAQLQGSAQQSQIELTRADAGISEAREHVNRLLGLSSDQIQWKISGGLPALPATDDLPENLEALARELRLDLSALHTQTELAQKAFALKQRTRLLPGAANLGLSTERDTDGSRLTGPSVGVQLPLFDQGQPELARLSAELRQSQDRTAALTADIGSEVRTASAKLLASRQAAEFYQETLLPQRRAVLQETLLHYNAMQKSVYELLAAKQQQQLSERESIEALRDYWLARTELERAIGRRLPTLEAAPAAPLEKAAHRTPAEEHNHHSHH